VEVVMIDEDRDELRESTAAARQDIAATRERMSGTVAELERQISGKIESVKQRVDLGTLVRQHPWPALAAAFVAGVALSASGADRKAARATVQAAKRAPETAKRGASATAAGVAQLASAAVERIRGSSEDEIVGADDGKQHGGLKAKAAGVLQAQVAQLREEVSRGADELAGAAPPPPRTAGI
jgi:ElaB/YqjD/DUF883 family membrane-anchored ribosome-binding protein